MAPDSLGELLNVISGHVVMAMASKGADFQPGRPGASARLTQAQWLAAVRG